MRNTWVPPSAPDPEALLPRLIGKQPGSHHLSSKRQTSATQHLPPPARVTAPWGSPLGFSHLWGTRLKSSSRLCRAQRGSELRMLELQISAIWEAEGLGQQQLRLPGELLGPQSHVSQSPRLPQPNRLFHCTSLGSADPLCSTQQQPAA